MAFIINKLISNYLCKKNFYYKMFFFNDISRLVLLDKNLKAFFQMHCSNIILYCFNMHTYFSKSDCDK